MYPSLPQNDPEIMERTDELVDLRDEYVYDYDLIPGRAMVKKVPLKNEFAFKLLMEVADRQLTVMRNSRQALRNSEHAEHHESLWERTGSFVNKMGELGEEFLAEKVGDLVHQFFESLGKRYAFAETTHISQFVDLFQAIEAPVISKMYREDRMFAYMRLAGPNPMMLKRAEDNFEDRFPVDNAAFQKVAGEADSLERAKAESRLYMVDYAALENLRTGEFKGQKKYMASPLGLFYLPLRADGGRDGLMPVAIQCGQTPGPEFPIIQPHHGHAWLMARNLVQVADGNLHQSAIHLGRTHLFLEPFVLATFRQLSPRHPLYVLLDAHFDGTLAINNAAHLNLLAPGGVVDQIMSGTLEASIGLAGEDLKTHTTNRVLDLRQRFAERGVGDAELLPGYTYRDDALPLWDAIVQWTAEYIDLYYQSDSEVQNDTELRAWTAELVSPDGGRVTDFGENSEGKILTRDYLKQLVSMLIFKAGPEHAAVNFPQKELMSYVPNMPLAAFAPPPTVTTGLTEEDYIAMLPPLDAANMQLDTGFLLGGVLHTELGQYGRHYFKDPRIEPALERFQKRLAEIEQEITDRNSTRMIEYPYLLPSRVPQSINI